MLEAEFTEISILHFTLTNFGPGAQGQAEMRAEYYRGQLRAAMRRLPVNEDRLVRLLCEITEDLLQRSDSSY